MVDYGQLLSLAYDVCRELEHAAEHEATRAKVLKQAERSAVELLKGVVLARAEGEGKR